MKRIYFLFLLSSFSFAGFAQPVTADLFLSNNHFEDLSGNIINANAISYNQVVKIFVNVLNGNASGDAAPAGHFRLKIGLGAGMTINPGFDLSTAPLSNFFNWSLDLSGAQPQIVGNSIAPLPPNFAGTASFELEASTATTSTVSFNLLISNPIGTTTPLSDPNPTNNIGSNDYTVAGQLGFTTSVNNVSCYGQNNGSLTVNVSGGISPFNYSIFNTTTNTTTSNTNGTFNGLGPATYNITVTDAANNQSTGSVNITQPASALGVSSTAHTDVKCYGNATGTITVVASGGTGLYSYAITAGTTMNTTGAGSGAFINLAAGNYTVRITDANNCTYDVANIILSQPSAALALGTPNKTNIACYGDNTGSISVSASGGTGPYTYSISPGTAINNDGNFTGLTAGGYAITVTDANNCTTSTGSIVLSQPMSALSATLGSTTNINCYGLSTGTISVSASGGTLPYTYAIAGPTVNSSGATNGNFTGLKAGIYSVTVTDANLCTKIVSGIELTEPASALSIGSVAHTDVNCFGASTGTITVTASGGTFGYSFTLSPGGATNNTGIFNNLSAGDYTVAIADAKGCGVTTGTISIMQPSLALTAGSPSVTDVACFGNSTGAISVSASGGTSPYTYAISPGTATNSDGSFSGLNAGAYTVTIMDSKGCTTSVNNIVVNQPSAALTNSIQSSVNINCYGDNSGSITAVAGGGTFPYAYEIFAGTTSLGSNTSGIFSNLAAGSYTITATDAKGCSKDAGVTLTQPSSALSAGSTGQTNINCYGNATGAVSMAATGGTPNYTYVITSGTTTNTSGASSGTFSNLAAGTYVITVTDGKGCTTVVNNIQLTQPSAPLTSSPVTKVNNTCHGGTNGQITISASGGTPNYTYAISPGTATNNNGVFTNLAAGTYSITITDAKGCAITVSNIAITEPVNTDPDVILSVADYTDNFFPSNNTNVTLIYQLTEINGNPGKNVQIKISKQSGYAYSLVSAPSLTIGSGINATTYALDNRWTEDNTDAISYYLNLVLPKQLDCGQSMYIGVKLSRTTPNKSTFTLTSNVRNVTNETRLNNNSTTVVLVGQ